MAFETPHRLRAALEDILATLGDRPIAACRELTKLHEEVYRGVVSEALLHFAKPRGEFTLVSRAARRRRPADRNRRRGRCWTRLRQEGLGAKEVVALVAKKSGLSRREAYRLWLEIKGEQHQTLSRMASHCRIAAAE